MHIIIIGTGLSGYNLAKEIHKLNPAVSLTLFTQDDGSFYSKPLLSTALHQQKNLDELRLASKATLEQQLNATIHTHTRIEKVDVKAKKIHFNRKELPYDKLIFATGAQSKILSCETKNTLSVNSLADYTRFRERLTVGKTVGIIGAGLVAMEFAHDLSATGFHTTVIAPDLHALSFLLPKECGEEVEMHLKNKAVTFYLQHQVKKIEEQNNKFHVEIVNENDATNKNLEFDLLLKAIGLIPNIRLAKEAGIHTERGIAVNDFLETSHPDIYALGDCAEISGKLYPYVLPLMQCSRALAKTLCGEKTPVIFPLMPIVIKTTPSITLMPPEGAGHWSFERSTDGMIARFLNFQQELKGFVLMGKANTKRQELLGQLQRG